MRNSIDQPIKRNKVHSEVENERRRRPISMKIVFAVAFIIFCIYAAYILFFFLFGLIIALKADKDTYSIEYLSHSLFTFKTSNLNFGNFVDVFTRWEEYTDVSYFEMVWNSVWRTIVMTFVNWMCTSLVCYVLVHYKNRLTKFIYDFGLFISMIPLYGAGAAEYRLFSQLNFINSPLIYITQISLFGSNFFYMYAFWKSISWEYGEASLIDGASHWGTFWKVMFPMVLPSSISLFIMLFIGNWNDYSYTNLYMQAYPDLSYGIYALKEQFTYKGYDMPLYYSGFIISFIPILILFVCFQNTIMEKVYLGGLKG